MILYPSDNASKNCIHTLTSNFIAPDVDHLPHILNQLSTISINSDDVSSALSSLDTNKAMGHDNVSLYFLKNFSAPLIKTITNLFQHSIANSCIPSEWEAHKICPVFKSGDKSNVSNYRPISLLPVLSKALESIIFRKIIPYVYPRISMQQFGFIQG